MRPDKRLGQHFLLDAEVLEEISAVADVGRAAGVLEIGPGDGALTAFLVQSGRPVHAIDLDPRAVAEIQRRFGDAVQVVQGDAVEADLASLLPAPNPEGRRAVVVGNLPYNAGSAIYRRLLGLGDQVERLVLMFQREVARRIVAGPGSRAYGLLSVVTALQARAWMIREVPPTAFRPRPKVHSAVVLVEPLGAASPLAGPGELDSLTRFVGRLFQSRRKTIGNTITDVAALARLGIDPGCRAETIAPETLLTLYRDLGDPHRS